MPKRRSQNVNRVHVAFFRRNYRMSATLHAKFATLNDQNGYSWVKERSRVGNVWVEDMSR